MAINKLIKTKLERPALLVETVIDVDADYFIAEINRILNIKNLDFVTNVKGRMTDWDAFNNNEKFQKTLSKAYGKLSKHLKGPFTLEDSWGIKMEGPTQTTLHNHPRHDYGGVLYLNDSEQTLNFPELDVEVIPKKGVLVVFNGFIYHEARQRELTDAKYAIAFNINVVQRF
tara:strand:- start:45 stop:560 length:516 start_codon:yes stop_codon:yes gene_type:complete